jgi:hypothetical protein
MAKNQNKKVWQKIKIKKYGKNHNNIVKQLKDRTFKIQHLPLQSTLKPSKDAVLFPSILDK